MPTTSNVHGVARLTSAAASTNATVAKARRGFLFGVLGHNAAAAVRYLKIYDKATAPTVGTDIPVLTIALPASTAFSLSIGNGLAFRNGISFALTVGAADADTAALTLGDVLGLNLIYG